MAMNRIDRPPHVQSQALEQFKKSNQANENSSQRTGRPQNSGVSRLQQQKTAHSAPNEKVADSVEISANAKKLNNMRQMMVAGRRALAQEQDTRQEKLDLARQRLNAGFYNSEEVRQSISDRLQNVIKKLDEL